MCHRSADLDRFPDAADGAAHLLNTACEWRWQQVQCYAVDLET